MTRSRLKSLGQKLVKVEPRPATDVTTLELFFDLVFVFSTTRITTLVIAEPDARGLLRAMLELSVVWWMYDGFAWVTNTVRPDHVVDRLLLLSAMGGFLVIALAVPRAFGPDGSTYGLSFLFVTFVHAVLLLRSGVPSVLRATLGIAPFNVGGALLIVVAGQVTGALDWMLWSAALLVFLAAPLLGRTSGFGIATTHFVERHGLLMLIAFGESVIAVGVGAEAGVDFALASGALLGLTISAGMFWCYFDGDDARAELALRQAPEEGRSRLAFWAFGGCHLIMIAGVVVLAAGVRLVIAHADRTGHGPGPALLAAGVATFLLGDALWRRTLDLGPSKARVLGAATASLTVAAGLALSPVVEMVLLAAVLAAVAATHHVADEAAELDDEEVATITEEPG